MYRFSDSEFSAADWSYYLHRDGRRGRDRIFASRRVARGADAVVGTQPSFAVGRFGFCSIFDGGDLMKNHDFQGGKMVAVRHVFK